MRSYQSFLIFLSVFFFGLSGNAQLENQILSIVNGKNLSNAQVAVEVRNARGEVLFSHNGEVGMIPASTLKLVTALSVIDIKGGDYKYETEVGYIGEVSKDRTLYGDLVIIGSGDPSLGAFRQKEAPGLDEVIDQIVNAINSRIKCIEGDLIIDASIFDNEAVHPGWAWDDLSNYYATGIWGLNIHQNLYHLTFGRTSQTGATTSVQSIAPEVKGLRLENNVTIGQKGSGDQAYIFGDPYGLHKNVEGTIPPGTSGFKIKGAIPDSRIWFGELLKKKLEMAGIKLGAIQLSKVDSKEIIELETLRSPVLSSMAKYALAVSDNMYCDAFYKTIGTSSSTQGNWLNAARKMTEYLSEEGLDIRGYHQEDGSGLTLRNRISASFLTSFLANIANSFGNDELLSLLPKAGKDGSVRGFLKGFHAQDYVWGKSGSVNGVLAYAGVISQNSQSPLFFSINVNGHQQSNAVIRKELEQIIEKIYLATSAK